MSRIRGKDTTPEIIVRSLLHRMGYRFSLHRRDLPGKPDIVLPKYRTVIFVHGCFWHRHRGCRFTSIPKTHKDYWAGKLRQTERRDFRDQALLESQGWRVIIIWECEALNDKQCVTRRLARYLASSRAIAGSLHPQPPHKQRTRAKMPDTQRQLATGRPRQRLPTRPRGKR